MTCRAMYLSFTLCVLKCYAKSYHDYMIEFINVCVKKSTTVGH